MEMVEGIQTFKQVPQSPCGNPRGAETWENHFLHCCNMGSMFLHCTQQGAVKELSPPKMEKGDSTRNTCYSLNNNVSKAFNTSGPEMTEDPNACAFNGTTSVFSI